MATKQYNLGNVRGPQGADGKSAYEVAVENGFTGTESEFLASLIGPAGPKGNPGADGKDGTGVDIKGELSSTGDLPDTGSDGEAYLIGGDLWVWDGTKWANAGNIKGPQGAQGLDGKSAYKVAVENGFNGTESEWLASLVGPAGADGTNGSDGENGADGSAATISVGSVVPGSTVAVENVGTPTSAVLNFTLQKGDKGDTGSVGPAGSDGSNGADGSDGIAATIAIGSVTDGSTAAVSNAGTSNAAVLDFVIPRGADGSNGAAGADGSAATISIGSVVSGSTAAVSNAGTSNAAVFDFVIPRGEKGADGSDGAPGADGADGSAATISVGSVTDGSTATVENVGTSTNAVLNFTLEKGEKGDTGDPGPKGSDGSKGADGSDGADGSAATISVGSVVSGSTVAVENVGTSTNAVLNFTLEKGPQGDPGSNGANGADGADGSAATIAIGSVTDGSTAAVSNAGTLNSAVLDFVIPRGKKGDKGDTGDVGPAGSNGANGADGADGSAATIAIGSVVSGSTAAVSNAGNSNAAVLDFVIPQGEKGADGSDGAPGAAGADGSAATISVGSVIVSDATTVENVGTSTAAVLNFTLQQGPAGSTGPQGAPGSDAVLTPATAASLGAVKIGSGISVTADGTISAQGGATLNDMQFAYARNAYIGASIPVSVVYTSVKGAFNGIEMYIGEGGSSISSVDKTGANADIILRTPAFFKRPGDYGCTIDSIKKCVTFNDASIISSVIPYGSTDGYTVTYDSKTGFIHINFNDCTLVFSRMSGNNNAPITITIPIHIGITGVSGVGVADDSFVTFTVPSLS